MSFILLFAAFFAVIETVHAESGHSDSSEAHGHRHGSHAECPLPKSANDVLICAREFSPATKRSRLTTEELAPLPDVARQIPNPDIDLQSGWGNVNGIPKSNIQLGVRQPIEWGGRRAARLVTAQAQIRQASADLRSVQADVTIEAVSKLHRIRQIDNERRGLESTIAALGQIIKQLKARDALSPEQQGSLAVFSLALSDSKIRLSETFEEERGLEHFFHVTTGHSLDELRPVLPTAPRVWPEIRDESLESSTSPAVSKSLADLEVAMASLRAAQADSWPRLSVGPQITFDTDGGDRGTLYGISLAMEVPVFNINTAGRSLAKGSLVRAEAFTTFIRDEESHERSEQLRVYRNALAVLNDTSSVEQIEKAHAANERLAGRGLLPAALLIESHRQRNDLTKGRNGRELKAIEALWRIHKFDGQIFDVKL